MAVFTVYGINAAFSFQSPTDKYAVARLRPANLIDPAVLTAFELLLGHSAMRPCEVSVVVSVMRTGLSTTSDSTGLRNQEPSYPTRTMPWLLPHSSTVPISV